MTLDPVHVDGIARLAGRLSDAERLGRDLLEDSRDHSDVINEQLSLMVLGVVALHRGKGSIARARFQ